MADKPISRPISRPTPRPAARPVPPHQLRQSPLHKYHLSHGAKFAAFGGWSMPLEYDAGVLKEHHAVREAVGVFDLSHLGKLLVRGPGAAAYLNRVLTNDLDRIEAGQAQYTLCCDAKTGGIVDDLIAYRHGDDRVLLMPNAANADTVRDLIAADAPTGVSVIDHHDNYAVLAVQGTGSDELLSAVGLPAGHDYMSFVEATFDDDAVVVCRTGYTGERGYELVVNNRVAPDLWEDLLAAGAALSVLPCGLAARDTLRTEMGYPLHGRDISVDTTPNQAGLGWAVGWQKPAFWGKEALVTEKKAGVARVLRGLIATGRAIPRPGMGVTLVADVPLCDVTSGTFSPTLQKGIGLALVPTMVNPDAQVGVDVRGRREIFQLVKPPFVPSKVRAQTTTRRPAPPKPQQQVTSRS
ncbi:MAG: glycine cleavage system aminomethyltransferase GcvT [Nocardioides sp.]